MQIKFECEHCGQHMTVEESSAGQAYVCPNCRKEVEVPRRGRALQLPVEEPPAPPPPPPRRLVEEPPPPPPPPPPPAPRPKAPAPAPVVEPDIYPVTIVDINMKFGSMVRFMIKWALASIPACLVVMLIFALVGFVFWLLFLVLAGGFAAVLK
jgi:predicted RNA-binding Zn-ribbon protein involved in translation (DUF1610 family)